MTRRNYLQSHGLKLANANALFLFVSDFVTKHLQPPLLNNLKKWVLLFIYYLRCTNEETEA